MIKWGISLFFLFDCSPKELDSSKQMLEIKSIWYLRKPANIKPSEFAIRHTRVLPERKFLKVKKCQESSPSRLDAFRVATVFKANRIYSPFYSPVPLTGKTLKSKTTRKQNRKKQKTQNKNNVKKTISCADIENYNLELNTEHKHI